MAKKQRLDKASTVNVVVTILFLFYSLSIVVIVFGGYAYGWQWTGVAERTFWDWLNLVLTAAVPVLVAVYGSHISRIQYEGQRAAEDASAQDEALQAYLDQMSQLLLDKDRSLRRQTEEGDEERVLARARTLTVLTRLDGNRKRNVVLFLYESGLIQEPNSIVCLYGADLRNVILSGANLIGADLRGAVLTEANLQGANLAEANLSSRFLSRGGTGIGWLDTSPEDPSTPEEEIFGPLAVLYPNDIVVSYHSSDRTHPTHGVAFFTDLSNANLSNANLSNANLNMVKGVVEEVLEQQAHSLEGATMPNGQKYEEWLKDRKGRGAGR